MFAIIPVHHAPLARSQGPELQHQRRERHWAVLGCFSAPQNKRQREVIRLSWWDAHGESGILTRFAVRGLNASSSVLAEAQQHGDVVLLQNVSAPLGRFRGMLLSLMAWMDIALITWPHVPYIGKADDDIWADLHSIASSLRASHELMGQQWWLVWGSFEIFHWDVSEHRPVGWCGAPACPKFEQVLRQMPNCTKDAEVGWLHSKTGQHDGRFRRRGRAPKDGAIVGPFMFPRGPLLLLAAPLANAVVASGWVHRELERTIESIPSDEDAVVARCTPFNESCGALPVASRPWEDVFLGVALAKVAPKFREKKLGVAAVHVGCPLFHSYYGFFLAPGTVVWHDYYSGARKSPERIASAHRWAEQRHCQPRTHPSVISCEDSVARPWSSCSGVRWRRCEWRAHRSTGAHNHTCSRAPLESLQDGGARFATCRGTVFGHRGHSSKPNTTQQTQAGATCQGCQLLY